MVTIVLELDKEIEREARSRGLLSSEKITQMIEHELREQRRQEAAARLRTLMDSVSDQMRRTYGDLTDEEAQILLDEWIAEVDADEGNGTST